jgi:hypothetical protein
VIAIFLPPLSPPLEGFRLSSVGLKTRFELRESRSISSSSGSRGRFLSGGESVRAGGLGDLLSFVSCVAKISDDLNEGGTFNVWRLLSQLL